MEGESGLKIKLKDIVDVQWVNILVLPLVGLKEERKLG